MKVLKELGYKKHRRARNDNDGEEFIKAVVEFMDKLKAKLGRNGLLPSLRQLLQVLKGLGYNKGGI